MAVSDDIEIVVEDTKLPRRLKDKVYRVINEKGVTDIETADKIAQKVEAKYIDTRVDPLDPVGTVSAQSIGEPGTQMSVPRDEEILVRRNGETHIREIGPLVDSLMASRETRVLGNHAHNDTDDHEVALAPDGIEVLSLGQDEHVRWKPIEEVSRHAAPEELLRITLASGREIRATESHSFVTRKDNEVVPVAGSELDAGDWLPVVGDLAVDDETERVDLRDYLPPDEYLYTSLLTDGGSKATVPGGSDRLRTKQTALAAGDLEAQAVYPVDGTVGLPERFPLDEETGFFVGAFLAEGTVSESSVSISNGESAVHEWIRSFTHRFGFSLTTSESDRDVADGCGIRVDGTVLADFLAAACFKNDTKTVPGFAFGASSDFVRGLLSGYFSASGDAILHASSSSSQLLDGIALLLARVGVYATRAQTGETGSQTLRVPTAQLSRFATRAGMIGEQGRKLDDWAAVDSDESDEFDLVPNFGTALETVTETTDIPQEQVTSATNSQQISRERLSQLIESIETGNEEHAEELDALWNAVNGDVVWDRIESIEPIESEHEHVYDVSVAGLQTFTTATGIVTHNTMNTFHFAGVAEIDVTQGLPRLIELVDARKTPDTPTMKVHLEDEYASDRERAHEVVWKIEATRILALGDVSTNVADMLVSIDLNEETLRERWPTTDSLETIVAEIADTIESELGVETYHQATTIEFGPEEPSYRDLLQLVEELRDIVFKGIGDVSRVVIRKEEREESGDQEFVLYTEGAAFGKVLEIEGVDATRTTSNNIHEVYRVLGVEAARERIIEETMNTLEEQGLGDVNIRHLMLVADIMTNRGTIESIGRHGISGNKESVLARAAFEVTVNHLLDAAIHGESDALDGVTENVIVGKPIKLGTGDVTLRMGSTTGDTDEQ